MNIFVGSIDNNLDDPQGVYTSSTSLYQNSGSTFGNITLAYNQTTPAAIGWLDYIELNYRRQLLYSNYQTRFRDVTNAGSGLMLQYNIGNMNSNLAVWDVTNGRNIQQQSFLMNGSTGYFYAKADTLREYIAFDPNNGLLTPTPGKKIANQNLHGLPQANMLIVTYPDFLAEAERLADYHRVHDNLTVNVTTPQLIYNEFSSVAPKISQP